MIALVIRNWKLVAGGFGLVTLALLLVFAKADARHWAKIADQRRDVILLERQAHQATVESLRLAKAAIDAKNAETEDRARAFDAARTADRSTIAEMDTRRRDDGNRVATLTAMVKSMPLGGCKAPVALLDTLKGM